MEELKQLAGQKGFAGETSVIGKSCLWLRHIDYQPPRNEHDIGYMEFNGRQLLETGLANNYSEIWEQLPDSQGATYAFQFREENSTCKTDRTQAGMLLVSGDYFIFARDRITALPHAISLEKLLTGENLSQQQLIELLDFEVSFGRVAKGNIPWEIQHSTLPFREGKSLLNELTWTAISQAKGEYTQHEQAWNGLLKRQWIYNPELHGRQESVF